MNLNKRLKLALLLLGVLASTPVYALQEPRAIATDSRIRTLRFSENEVYQYIGHYGYQSFIEFGQHEKIQTVSVGDSVSWLINPSGNRLFLKPIDQNALTNMTVITDKHQYLFELHAEETKNIRDKNLVFEVRFVYEPTQPPEMGISQFEEFPEVDKHPEKFNFNYTVRGSSLIEPLRVFDDGNFTYFEFRDQNAEIPAFFNVDANLDESLINFRKRGNYIVVERVASRFTLRRGPDILCIYNERMPLSTVPTPPKSFWQHMRDYQPIDPSW